MSHIKITSPDGKRENTTIELDGIKLDRVTEVMFVVGDDVCAWVRLTFAPNSRLEELSCAAQSVEIDINAPVYANTSPAFTGRGA